MTKYSQSPFLKPLRRIGEDEHEFCYRDARRLPFLQKFPSTRFYGSKRKQLEWLAGELRGIKGVTALDAFGGTGAVSHLLDSLGWETTYNDIFDFNIISARAIFSKSTDYFSRDDLLGFLRNIEANVGFVAKTFDGLYYTHEENCWLDGALLSVEKLDPHARDLVLYLIFQACLKKRPFNLFHRVNLHLRESKVPVKFGNRTTWNKSFDHHIICAYDELYALHRISTASIKINDPSCAKDVGPGFDLIYIDPPYFKKKKRNTDTYLQRYHFLEGLARYHEWHRLIDAASAQRVIKSPYRGELTNKLDLLSDLKQMMRTHPNSKFALSYVSDEAPTEEELYELFKGHFDRVRLARSYFSKALSNKSTFEILLIGQ